MMRVADCFVVTRPMTDVFALFDRFETIARCLPTLKRHEVRPDGSIDGVVGVSLGGIPVESRVHFEIVHREPPRCIAARGLSFMGETIASLRDGRKAAGIDRGSMGRIYVHFDFRPWTNGSSVLTYEMGVEAEGRLRRMYEGIIRSKVPALQKEFREKIVRALDGATLLDAPAGYAPSPCEAAIGSGAFGPQPAGAPAAAPAAPVPAAVPVPVPVTARARGLIRRLLDALARLLSLLFTAGPRRT